MSVEDAKCLDRGYLLLSSGNGIYIMGGKKFKLIKF